MQGQSSHAPLASLAAHWHACQGEIPPPLVGASVTLVDYHEQGASTSSLEKRIPGKVYLFGGRLVTTRRMINDLYILDLSTLRWTRHVPTPRDVESDSPLDTQLPQPRYFHSCDLWRNKLIIFGGMGYDTSGTSDLCVLNETVAFDLDTQQWDLSFGGAPQEIPQARYAHLSSITADSLVIIGGQDMGNQYVESIDVFDLETKAWRGSQSFPKQRGSYRSLAVGPTWLVDEHDSSSVDEQDEDDGSVFSRKNIQLLPTSRKSRNIKGKERHLPIYVYTNYNFTDVKREMEVVNVLDQEDNQEEEVRIQIEEQTDPMNGASLPPGLRFPMGAVLGNYLLISGTYLANTSQTFAIWALNIPKMTWTRIDVGQSLATGSWNRGVLWPNTGRMLVFGHRDRDLVSDYNHRQTNWDHLLMLDLEAWGITRPPLEIVSSASIDLGLQKLASSTLGSLSHSLATTSPSEATIAPLLGGRGDFEIVCSDGVRLGCDRAILERRWLWFAVRLAEYKAKAAKEAQRISKRVFLDCNDRSISARLTPRQLLIREQSPVMLSLLVFFYTQSICTSFQRHPAIIASLLILARIYEMPDLQVWAKHAAHHALATDLAPADTLDPRSRPISTSSTIQQSNTFSFSPGEKHRLAVAIYEAATICGYEALQIRSLRNVMAVAKWVQRASIASTRSNEVPSEPHSLAPKNGSGHIDAHRNSASNSIRSVMTNNTAGSSPASNKRVSTVSANTRPRGASISLAEEGSSSMVRKLSKAERMLGMNGAEAGTGQHKSMGNGDASKSTRGHPVGSGVNRASSQSAVPTQQSMVASSRRPSAPVLTHASSHANGTSRGMSSTDYGSMSSIGGKKRFSIFGRNESHHDGMLQSTAEDGTIIAGSAKMNQRSMSTNGMTEVPPTSHDMSPSQTTIGLPGSSSLADRRKGMERGKMTSMSRLRSGAPAAILESNGNTPPNSGKLNPSESNALYSISSL